MKHIDILIIDDEKKFAGMLSKRLELRNIRCHTCYDGASGIEWIKRNPSGVSLILLDLKLPDIYGIQVMGEIKKTNPDLPVVIVTGHGTEEDKKKCMELGARDFSNKPLRIESIVKLFNTIRGTA